MNPQMSPVQGEGEMINGSRDAYSQFGDYLTNFKLSKKDISLFVKKVKKITKSVGNDYEFIDKMLSMIPFDHMADFKSDQVKSSLQAKISREIGNSYFGQGNMVQALEYYTKSIAYAEPGSEDLGVAFANRSAVLFQKQYYRECLQDIQRALVENYPVEKSDKLLRRKEKAEKSLPIQKIYRYHGTVPEIQNKHSDIVAAAECLEVKENAFYGRHVVASKDIKAGDLVVVEKPYAKVVKRSFRTLHCSECTELCYNMIPCEKCSEVLYCSDACRELALRKYHHYECEVLKTTAYVSCADPHVSLFLRMSIQGLKEYDDFKTPNTTEKYQSDRFKEINNLCTNRDKFSVQECLKFAFRPALAYKALVETTDILSKIIGTDELDEKKKILKEILFKNFLIINSNITGINSFSKARYESLYIGGAIHNFTSLFNHACNQNLDSTSYGDTVALHAHRNIKKGEQCFINYGTTLIAEAKPVRAEKLREYNFTCTCTPCNENWPTKISLLLAGYRRAPQVAMIEEEFVQDRVTEENMQEFLQRCFKMVESLKYEPEFTVNHFSLTNLIRICFSSMSNKDLAF